MAAPYSQNISGTSDNFSIAFVNSKFGNDLKSLSSIKTICKEFTEKKSNLQKQLCLVSSEVPSELERAIRDAEQVQAVVQDIGEQKQGLQRTVAEQVEGLSPLVSESKKLTEDVEKLEKLSKYLACIVEVEDVSSGIQTALLADDVVGAVGMFMALSTLYTRLHPSHCHNLVRFARDTTLFWYKILTEKIAKEFEEVLRNLKWPLVATAIKAPSVQNIGEARARMEELFKYLLKLQLPDGIEVKSPSPHTAAHLMGQRPPILPLQLMIKPLRKRFRYHFYGNKQTNDRGKPEWYFTQVLSWIRDHTDFLDQRIQPLLREAGSAVDAKVEFMKGMVVLVVEKMVTDLPDVVYDEHQFCHLVDEALLFERELRLAYGYPASRPSSLHVLTERDVFDKWLHIEKKFAMEKLDAMMSSPSAWESQYENIADVDDMKVPECGESFMTLMLTITDRYKPLPMPVSKLAFLDLQLELLEDFRIRIVQVKVNTHNPLGRTFSAILNTAYYISEVLREWSELVFFLQLQFYRQEYSRKGSLEDITEPFPADVDLSTSMEMSLLEEDLDNTSLLLGTTVFEDMIQLFERLRNDMMATIVNHVFTDVRARSKPYRDDRWISLPFQKDVSLGLSTSACEMLLVLKDHLLEVGEMISKPLFTQFWEKLAEKLNRFIFDELIVRNNFNDGGAAQLQFDMTRNLFPLFGEYTPKPDSYFRDVKEACVLLNLKKGSALLLKEMLNEALHTPKKDAQKINEALAALHDIGVYKLTLKPAERIFILRTNLAT